MEFLNKKCPHVGNPKALRVAYDPQTGKSVQTEYVGEIPKLFEPAENPFLSFQGLKRPASSTSGVKEAQEPQATQESQEPQATQETQETSFPELEVLEVLEPLEPLEPLETLKISKPSTIPDSYKNIKLDDWSTKNPRMVERIDADNAVSRGDDDDPENLRKEIHRMNEIGMINTLRERSSKQREELEKQIEQDEIHETMKTRVVNRKQAMSYAPFEENRKQIVLDRAEIAKMTPEQIYTLFNP